MITSLAADAKRLTEVVCSKLKAAGLKTTKILSQVQVRSQDLVKGGGGYFERVRKVQTTLTRIFIVIESESHGLSQN